MPPSILLMRHGETVWNLERRMQGRLDSPLTWRGIQQARACAITLSNLTKARSVDYIYTSPLGRCWQTAVIVADQLNKNPSEIVQDTNLKEISWGDWDGLTAAEIEDRDPIKWQATIDSQFTIAPPNGDTINQVFQRAKNWLANADQLGCLIIVSHGMFGRALRCAYQNLPSDSMLGLADPHDSIFELTDGRVSEWQSSPTM